MIIEKMCFPAFAFVGVCDWSPETSVRPKMGWGTASVPDGVAEVLKNH